MLDQTSLLIAIGFSATALMLTLVITWLGTRQDHYLLSWGIGLGLVAPGSMLYGWFEAYDPAMQCLAFVLLLAGFAFIYIGCTQFSSGRTPWRSALVAWLVACTVMTTLFAVGLSGVGTMVMNIAASGFFLAAGREHWLARANTPLAMLAKSALYGSTAVTFALCAAVHLLADGIRQEFASTDPLPGDFGPPTVSAGIAIASPRPETFGELLRAADELLYRAKDAGRNRVHGPELRLAA